MKVTAIQCPKCKMWVYSRNRHDMRWCPCGAVAIDGGRSYMKIAWKDGVNINKIKRRIFKIRATRNDLAVDYNTYGNRLGYIKPHVAKRAMNRRSDIFKT